MKGSKIYDLTIVLTRSNKLPETPQIKTIGVYLPTEVHAVVLHTLIQNIKIKQTQIVVGKINKRLSSR